MVAFNRPPQDTSKLLALFSAATVEGRQKICDSAVDLVSAELPAAHETLGGILAHFDNNRSTIDSCYRVAKELASADTNNWNITVRQAAVNSKIGGIKSTESKVVAHAYSGHTIAAACKSGVVLFAGMEVARQAVIHQQPTTWGVGIAAMIAGAVGMIGGAISGNHYGAILDDVISLPFRAPVRWIEGLIGHPHHKLRGALNSVSKIENELIQDKIQQIALDQQKEIEQQRELQKLLEEAMKSENIQMNNRTSMIALTQQAKVLGIEEEFVDQNARRLHEQAAHAQQFRDCIISNDTESEKFKTLPPRFRFLAAAVSHYPELREPVLSAITDSLAAFEELNLTKKEASEPAHLSLTS